MKLTICAGLLATMAIAMAITGARAQDVEAGVKVFNQCRACHQIGETARNLIGPKLNGIIGRKAGSIEGFAYSTANRDSGLTWDEATFAEYIRDPRAKVHGTKMIVAGLIAFLKQFDASGKKE